MIMVGNLRLLAIAAAILASIAAGWKLRDWQADAEAGARAGAELAAQRQIAQFAHAVSASTEAAIQNIRVENRTIYQRTQREITEKPVYHDCVLPADGVRLVNAARAGSAGQLDGAVPTASATPGER